MTLSDNMRAALFMMTAMAAFTVNDAFMKLAFDDVPFFQAIATRGMMIILGLSILAYLRGQLTYRPDRKDWGLISLRTLTEAISTVFFLLALRNMPIGNLSAILQALPLTVTLAAALFLRETVGWKRLTAILVGFIGVVLIIQPGTDGFTIYSLFGVAAVIAVTVRDLASRKLSRDIPSGIVALAAAVGVTVMAFALGAGEEWVVPEVITFAQLAGAAGCLMAGYICSISAMRSGDIGFVAPFRYTSLVVALILGFVVFGEWPNNVTILGAAIVVLTGLFTLYRERAVASRPSQGLRIR